jgi:hypothetical protein
MEETVEVNCPHCGESFTTFVDLSAGPTSYIEDCQVCCKPINMAISLDQEGQVEVLCGRD